MPLSVQLSCTDVFGNSLAELGGSNERRAEIARFGDTTRPKLDGANDNDGSFSSVDSVTVEVSQALMVDVMKNELIGLPGHWLLRKLIVL